MQVRLEILFEREISFASSKNPQKIFIARNVNEEILALVYSEDGRSKLFKKFIFTHPFYGQYEYNSEAKTWLPKEFIHSKELCLIRKIDFFQLPNDSFYSIFLEVLLEEPPIGLFSVPFVIREGEIIFNGLEELSPQKFLKQNHYSTFQYKDGKLEILTNSNKLGLTYIYDKKRFLLVTK
ncbi:MAG: hypothetical protein N3A69_13005 [Leptospiraceae bacterium]|nr:hypothetical protein [Leptospiraceae bacterium]